MTQIVINCDYGGFGLSIKAQELYKKFTGKPFPQFRWEIQRDDPYLVQVVLQLGEAASDGFANLKVVTIPDDVEWIIDEYDGNEWVAEKHRTWR